MQHLAHILLFLLAALTGLNLFPFSTASPPTTMAFNPLSTQISGRALRSGLDFWDHEFGENAAFSCLSTIFDANLTKFD